MQKAPAPAAVPKVGDWAWHVHHGKLYERLIEPMEARADYIRRTKIGQEETRLKLMRPVSDQDALTAADSELQGGWSAYEQALDALVHPAPDSDPNALRTTVERRLRSVVRAGATISRLHAQDCEPDCPWNGKTIFPGPQESNV